MHYAVSRQFTIELARGTGPVFGLSTAARKRHSTQKLPSDSNRERTYIRSDKSSSSFDSASRKSRMSWSMSGLSVQTAIVIASRWSPIRSITGEFSL